MMSRVSMHEAVMEDALGPLLELAHSSDDADLVEQIVDILEALATAGGDAERQMMCMDGAEGVCCFGWTLMRYRDLSCLAGVRVSTGALQRVVENHGFSDTAHAKATAVLALLQTAQPTPVADT